jgi:hypothetical protein
MDAGPRGRSSSPGRVKNFHFSTSSRPALGPTQPPIQRVPGALSPGVNLPGREDEDFLDGDQPVARPLPTHTRAQTE